MPPRLPHAQNLRVVTHAAFHPCDPNVMGYSTSKQVLALADLRQKDIRGTSAKLFTPEPLEARRIQIHAPMFTRELSLLRASSAWRAAWCRTRTARSLANCAMDRGR